MRAAPPAEPRRAWLRVGSVAFPVGISFARLAEQLRARIEYVVDSHTDRNCYTSSAFLIPAVFCFCYTVGNPSYLTGLFKCVTMHLRGDTFGF